MKFKPMTEEEILNHPTREYNPHEWEKNIIRLSRFEKVQFYEWIDSPFSYPCFFATYQIPEGIILLAPVGYTSTITSNGFSRVRIEADGTVVTSLFKGRDGKEGVAENCSSNRKLLAKESINFGTIFTNYL